MNVVFTFLVLVSVLVAGWVGSPAHPAIQAGPGIVIALDDASQVKKDGIARVDVAGVEYPGVVLSVTPRVARATPDAADIPAYAHVASLAPIGEVSVKFDDEHRMKLVSDAALDQAKKAVELAIGLIGAMTLFLGLMKVVEAGGGLDLIAVAIRPFMVWLFPDVPSKHPAMGAMVMNIAANMLGLGNAATPFGIKAMQELDTLNRDKGTATNAMVLFLAINTTGLAVLPTGMMAVRAALGSHNPAAIFPTTIAASHVTTLAAVVIAKGLSRLFKGGESEPVPREILTWGDFIPFSLFTAGLMGVCAIVGLVDEATFFILPLLIGSMIAFGMVRKVKVYETLVEGAKEGFASATRIIPYVVAILVAVGMFRASGAMNVLVSALAVPARLLYIPPEVLPLAILRPLSGSGAFALAGDLTRTYGADSYIGNLAGTMQGTTETTFYVLAVYFGSVGVKKFRHAVAVGLLSEMLGILAAVFFVRWLIGGP